MNDQCVNAVEPADEQADEVGEPPAGRCRARSRRRRRGLGPPVAAALLTAALLAGVASQARGEETGRTTPLGESGRVVLQLGDTEQRLERDAIERGLAFLASRARPNGSIGAKYPVAVTSLAGLAFLGAGYHYDHGGKYSDVIDGCIRYILASSRSGGFISESLERSESRMHGHCYALLFLTQAYGELPPAMESSARVAIQQAIRCVVAAQSNRGGWMYEHDNPQNDDEASVTIGALQALRAARNTGFMVPRRCVEAAKRYVFDCQNADGGFRYSIHRGETRTSFALTAAAVSTLHAAGIYDSPALRKGFDFLDRELTRAGGRPQSAIVDPFFFYGALYATEAYFQRGGGAWSRWRGELRRHLLKKQRADGSWQDQYGDEFATAVAALILEVPIQYLPIFER